MFKKNISVVDCSSFVQWYQRCLEQLL